MKGRRRIDDSLLGSYLDSISGAQGDGIVAANICELLAGGASSVGALSNANLTSL